MVSEERRQLIIGCVIACVVLATAGFLLGVMSGAGERLIDGKPPLPQPAVPEPAERRDPDREFRLMTEIHNDLHVMRDDLRAIRSAMPRRGERWGGDEQGK